MSDDILTNKAVRAFRAELEFQDGLRAAMRTAVEQHPVGQLLDMVGPTPVATEMWSADGSYHCEISRGGKEAKGSGPTAVEALRAALADLLLPGDA